MEVSATTLLLSILLLTSATAAVTVWRTVLVSTTRSTICIRDLFDRHGLYPPGTPQNLSYSSVFDIANGRDEYRSPLIDNWATENHTEVRLVVFNKHGDLLWHMTLDGFGSDLTNWDRASRTESSTDSRLLPALKNLAITFDGNGLNVTRTDNNNGWLWIDCQGGSPKIYFSTYDAKTYPSGFVPRTNADAVNGVNRTYSTHFKESHAVRWGVGFGSSRYMIGMSIGKVGSSELTQFKMAYSSQSPCISTYPEGYVIYKEDDGTEKVFSATYVNDEAKFDVVTFFAQCVQIIQVSGSGETGFRLNLWGALDDYLEGAMFGIQWGIEANEDPLQTAISEIQQQLTFSKFETALYRSQFTSATDNRGSVVVFGVAGIIIFLSVILGIILLDLSTLTHQFRFMKRNFRDFKETVRKARQKFRERKAKKVKKSRLVDVKQVKVKVAGGGGALLGVKQSKGGGAPPTPKESEGSKGSSKEKGNGKSTFKKSVKTVMNKKTPATLSKISE